MRKLGIIAALLLFAASAFAQGERLFDYTDKIDPKNKCIYITGRKKNLIILSNGKNVYPEEIENYIRKSGGRLRHRVRRRGSDAKNVRLTRQFNMRMREIRPPHRSRDRS